MNEKDLRPLFGSILSKLRAAGFDAAVLAMSKDRKKVITTGNLDKEALSFAIYKLITNMGDARLAEAVIFSANKAIRKIQNNEDYDFNLN